MAAGVEAARTVVDAPAPPRGDLRLRDGIYERYGQMSELKMSSKLPKGDANGLSGIVGDLVENPHKVHALLVLVD